VISQVEADQAVRACLAEGRLFRDVLVERDFFRDDTFASIVVALGRITLVDLATIEVEPQAVQSIPAELAYSLGALPFSLQHGALKVVLNDPVGQGGIDRIAKASGVPIRPFFPKNRDVRDVLPRWYPKAP